MNIYKISFFVSALVVGSIAAMQPPTPPALSDFPFTGASVLPFTKWPSKSENYALLMREAFGNDAGTYDACGGSKNAKEKHPIVTAGREFAEETIDLLGTKKAIKKHLDVDAPYTKAVVANHNKRFVVYLTKFDYTALENFSKTFYAARAKATSGKNREKDKLAWVKWSNLTNAIAQAPRDQNGRLILPITVWANVVESDGTQHGEQITLRPVLVSTLQSYFKNEQYTEGKNKKIRFYQF